MNGRVVICSLLGASFASCFGPTEIFIRITTDLACSDVMQNGVAIAVGEPGVDSVSASASTNDCVDGGVGTLAVLPSGHGDAVGIRVMLGVDGSVETCQESNGFAACIVARRALRFSPHEELVLPIALDQACIAQQCDAASTCANGSCVDTTTSCDDAGTCDIADAAAPPPACNVQTATIASGVDALTPHIATLPSGNGYLVSWFAGGAIYAVETTSAGVQMGTPKNVVPMGLNDAAAPGPMATDGVAIVGFGMNLTTLGTVASLTRQLGNMGTAAQYQAGVMPLYGVLMGNGVGRAALSWGDVPGIYDINENNASPAPVAPLPGAPDGGTFFGLAQQNSTYLVSYVDPGQTCHTFSCDTTFTCSEVLTEPACLSVRVAPSVDPDAWGATLVDPTHDYFVMGRTSTHAAPRTDLGALTDVPEALIPLATGSVYRTVFSVGGLINFKTYPGSPYASFIGSSAGYPSGRGASFDAVSDGPTSSSFAVVYWQSSPGNGATIEFAHVCIP